MVEKTPFKNFEDFIYEVLADEFDEPNQILGDTACIGGFHIAINKNGIEVASAKEVKAFTKVGKAIKYLKKQLKKRGLRKRSTNPSFHEILRQHFHQIKPRGKYCAVVHTRDHPWLVWWGERTTTIDSKPAQRSSRASS